MKMTLDGGPELIAALRNLDQQAQREIESAVQATAQGVRSNAIRSIQRDPKTGLVYDKVSPRRTHRASAPGQAPATDTGFLAGSIQAEISGKTADVTANAEYAVYLEFGTRTIEPRPFMVPAMESERRKFNQRLSSVIDRATKRGSAT